MTELFAFGAVKAFEQGGDEVLLLLEFGTKGGVVFEQLLVLLDELGCLFIGHRCGSELRQAS
ncbi:hypothetical protein ACFQY0_03830 [Haloferula chungangensis]|uniref:Uncharacterized protein n=1 Tax=Haloferula chungangensis TaxID=1048331 RepID=A0ABW2L3Z7_9BACT